MTELLWEIKYNLDFLKHCRSHRYTSEENRLRHVIIQNYTKSLLIGNTFAFYLNYIRKNKSLVKTLSSMII